MNKIICILIAGLVTLGAHSGFAAVAKVKESGVQTQLARNAVLKDL